MPIPSWCAFAPPPSVVPTCQPHLWCAYVPLNQRVYVPLSRVLLCHKISKTLNPFNQSFILSSRYFFSILQQRCPSKASCRRQRIMADYIVVKFSSPTHHGTPPQMLTKPGDACHRCSLMSQVQEPFSNVAIFLVVGFGLRTMTLRT